MRLADLGRSNGVSNQRWQNALSTLVSMHFLEPETEDCVCVYLHWDFMLPQTQIWEGGTKDEIRILD
jgi:hypothetical protein